MSTASISGTRPAAGEAPYSAAKAAVVALTANAALEYAPTVRVNSVSPGMIRTTMTGPLLGFEGMTERMETKTPLARIGEPEDIADVVVFLCSELARFVTGQNLVIDGGMTLHGAGVDGLYDYFSDLLQRSRPSTDRARPAPAHRFRVGGRGTARRRDHGRARGLRVGRRQSRASSPNTTTSTSTRPVRTSSPRRTIS